MNRFQKFVSILTQNIHIWIGSKNLKHQFLTIQKMAQEDVLFLKRHLD